MTLSKKILDHPILTVTVFALMAILGLFMIPNLALELYPATEEPIITVFTSYENAGPESVEKAVTVPLEDSLVSVNKLKKLTSTSSEGSSMIMLEFNQETNLDAAVNEIRDKIDEAKGDLPTGVSNPSIFRMNTASEPIITLALRGNKSVNEMDFLAKNFVKSRLAQTDGVARAQVAGGTDKIIRVELSQNRLEAYGLTLTQVSESLASQNLDMGGGKIAEKTSEYTIRTTGEFPDLEAVNDTVVANVGGYDVRLSDIGRAFEGYRDEKSSVYINGEPGVSIDIQKRTGANTIKTADAVYEKIEEINATLPQGIHLEIIQDGSIEIRQTITALRKSLIEGLILAVIILFIFLKNFKSTIIISISIPLSLIITLLAMNLFGLSLNLMTMTGLILAVGMIVDASIVMLENISTYRERGESPKAAAVLGSQEMVGSVLSGNLTTICVFIPFIFYRNRLGEMAIMFKDVIFTVVIALLASLLVAIFLVPVLAGKFLSISNRKENPVTNPVLKGLYSLFDMGFDSIQNVYKRILRAALAHRFTTIVISLLFMLGTGYLATKLNLSMYPEAESQSVTLSVKMPSGTPYESLKEQMLKWQKIISDEVQGIKSMTMDVGMSSGGDEASNQGSIRISLPEALMQIDTVSTIKEKLKKHFGEFKGMEISFSKGMDEQLAGYDIDISVRSSSLNDAIATADGVKKIIKSISGFSEPISDTSTGLPQIEVSIDRDRASSFGVTVAAAANEIAACVNGIKATKFRKQGKEYDMIVMFEPEDRSQVLDLDTIFVAGTNGRVCVANFADIKKGYGPVSIQRENQEKTIHVTASITGSMGTKEAEDTIKNKISTDLILPDGVTISYEGQWGKIAAQSKVFAIVIFLALLMVFGVMAGTYESYKAPFINMMTIPFLAIGVVLIYFISGQAFSVLSAIGLIMLVGIVVNNGIILVDYTGILIKNGMSLQEACFQAGISRLRPVLMTTLTTILGTIPMALDTKGMAAMIQPIGLCIVGGLTSSTFVTTILIPVVYTFIMKKGVHSIEN